MFSDLHHEWGDLVLQDLLSEGLSASLLEWLGSRLLARIHLLLGWAARVSITCLGAAPESMHSQGNATGGEKIWPALAGAPFNHFCSVNGLLLQGPVVKGSNPGEDPEVGLASGPLTEGKEFCVDLSRLQWQ